MYTLLVTGDVPGAATYFNPLLQQTTIPCASGTRPSSPVDGMQIYETDTRLYRSWNSALSLWIVMGSNGSFTYNPTLTGSTTNPGLGSGSTVRGKYSRGANGLVTATWYIAFGTSPSAGSGQYLVSLPVACESAFGGTDPEYWGVGRVQDLSVTMYVVSWYIPGGATSTVSAVINGGSTWGSGTFSITAGDHCEGTITYRAAAGS
jgi:hypothetical protein